MNPRDNKYKSAYMRAQTMLEYAVLICVIVAATVAMNTYFKRAFQGKLKGVADEVGGGAAYSPGVTFGNTIITKDITENTESFTEGNSYDFNFLNRQISRSYTTSESKQVVNRDEKTLPLGSEQARL